MSETIRLLAVAEMTCPGCGIELDVSDLSALMEFTCPDCDHPLMVPALLDRYRLTEILGTGAMGAVLGGKDIELDRDVAVKILIPNDTPRRAGEPSFSEQFLAEARSLAALRHAHIIQIFTTGTYEQQPYLVMEWLKGGSLKERIQAKGPLPASEVMPIGRAICEALAAAWQVGLLHGDVKPDNILFDETGKPLLADFGLVVSVDSDSAGMGAWGSVPYIAPEKLQQQPPDFRADLYSLGCTLFEALTGEHPFPGNSVDEVAQKHFEGPPDAMRFFASTPPGVVDLLQRFMATDPDHRPGSHDEALALLQTECPGEAPTKKSPLHPSILIGAGVFALAFGGVGLHRWLNSPTPGAAAETPVLTQPRILADSTIQGPNNPGEAAEFHGSEDTLWIKHHPEEAERTQRISLLKVGLSANLDPRTLSLTLTYAQRSINSRGTYVAELWGQPGGTDWSDNPTGGKPLLTWDTEGIPHQQPKGDPWIYLGRHELPHVTQAGETLVFNRRSAPDPLVWDRTWRQPEAGNTLTLWLGVLPDDRQRAGWKFASRENRTHPGPTLSDGAR